ncbi:MAG: Fur family transcriptional regulator [Bacilli bacterium]
MKEQGFKYTDKRKKMIEVLAEETKYRSAKQIASQVKLVYPSLSFDTIYRNLSVFGELGIAEETELDGEKFFRFRCSVNAHHHHFICTTCGQTKTIQTCPMDLLPDDWKGYTVTGHRFEVFGMCPTCSV